MGCGCKSKSKNNDKYNSKLGLKDSGGELNLKGKVFKIPLAIGLTMLFLFLSPILLIYIWYLFMEQIFTNRMLLFSFLNKFKKDDTTNDDGDDSEEINPDEYVLMDVDKVK